MDSPKLRIIDAGTKDLPRIAELKKTMFEEIGKGPLLAPDFTSLVLADYQRLYQTSEAHHVLAVDGDEILAMAGGFIKTDFPYRYFKKPRYGYVGDVYTMPKARKLGLAKDLSARILDWLKRQDIDMVRLLASDNARSVYEKMGFQATNEMALDV